jgi:hypothetical protein
MSHSPEYVRDIAVKVLLDRSDDGERRLREDGPDKVRRDAQFYDSTVRSVLKAISELGEPSAAETPAPPVRSRTRKA